MASTSQCKYCGSTVSSSDEHCPNCGAPNEGYVPDTERRIFLPQTIEELKAYCAERGMPLLKMRFFIGEDYREPKAFGIYRDGEDFIVYKNKADGQRAIRYQGPDEAFAVSELFAKLLEECHNRGIYPDGKTPESSPSVTRRRTKKPVPRLFSILFIVSFLISAAYGIIAQRQHREDGYYGVGDGTVYYHYGSDWYYTYDTNDSGFWYEAEDFPAANYADYSLGEDWNSDWGVSDFKSSSTWDEISQSHSSGSSDYDSWDSGDTDWDSDW